MSLDELCSRWSRLYKVSFKAAEIQDYCSKNNVRLLLPKEFPIALQQIFDPPEALFYRGNPELLNAKCLAMIGSRKPVPKIVQASLSFSKYLAKHGFTVVSGLAEGVDGLCHQGALISRGHTIAVLGFGLDRIYPQSHRRLLEQIVDENGLVLSEFPPFLPIQKYFFIKRNRIIAGLSEGVVVFQAGKRSGSLTTAQFAIDEGRDVFVLTGAWDDERFLGSTKLIQEGAHAVTRYQEILEHYNPRASRQVQLNKEGSFNELFNDGFTSLSELWKRSSMELSQLSQYLSQCIENRTVVEVAPHQFVWVG